MYGILFTIALRNILRRRLQTFLLGIMIALSTFTLFAMVGVQSGAYKLIEDSYTQVFNGDIQIRNALYEDIEDFDKLLPTSDIVIAEQLMDDFQNTKVFHTRRYIHFALGEYMDKNYNFTLVGIKPQQEKYTSKIFDSIQSGFYLDENSYNDILIGSDLANYFGVSLGSEIVLMTMDIYDSFVIDVFKVKGIYKTGDGFLDKSAAFIHANYFMDNIVYSNNNISNVTIKLLNSNYRADLLRALQDKLPSNSVAMSWDQVLPEIKQTIQFQFSVSMTFYILFVILIAFSLLNAMMLATVKRMPEFGIYFALGLDNKNFKWILFFENFILCTIFVTIGVVLGLCFVFYFSSYGIPLPALTEDKERPLTLLGNMLYPNPKDPLLFVGPALVYISCLLSIIPPVLKLMRSNPVQAITSV